MKIYVLTLVAVCLVAISISTSVEKKGPPQVNQAPELATQTPASATVANELQKAEISTPATAVQTPEPEQGNPAVAAKPSPVVLAVVSMTKAGVAASVLDAYVRTALIATLKPEEILYLHDHGVPASAITGLIERSAELKALSAQAIQTPRSRVAQQRPAQPLVNPAPAPAPRPVPQPAINNYYVQSPPAYNWGNQFYPYAYATYPVYWYGSTRPYRDNRSPPLAPNPVAQRPTANQNPGSSPFFVSTWQWNGTTGKPVDRR